MNHTIYMFFNRQARKVGEPKGPPERNNFVITYRGLDWSGFRTLNECIAQFNEIEAKPHADDFEVVERL